MLSLRTCKYTNFYKLGDMANYHFLAYTQSNSVTPKTFMVNVFVQCFAFVIFAKIIIDITFINIVFGRQYLNNCKILNHFNSINYYDYRMYLPRQKSFRKYNARYDDVCLS